LCAGESAVEVAGAEEEGMERFLSALDLPAEEARLVSESLPATPPSGGAAEWCRKEESRLRLPLSASVFSLTIRLRSMGEYDDSVTSAGKEEGCEDGGDLTTL